MSILSEEVYEKTGTKYPISMILRVVGCSSGNWYDKKVAGEPKKRGPKPKLTDEEALVAIRTAIEESPFVSEGYIKVWVRIRRKGLTVSKDRVLRIMNENELLSPYRHDKATVRVRKHEGKIVQGKPDLLWGTDGKKFFVEDIGWCWFFGVLDHFNDELISWHTCKRGTRYEALEPVRDAVRKRFGTVEKDVCKGMALKLRSDHGSQYDSNDFMAEMKFLGLNMSKAFVRQPECNGCIERFHRTLEEEVFSLNHFKTLDEANEAIRKFVDNYNRQWLIYRLGYKSPLEYREEYERKVA